MHYYVRDKGRAAYMHIRDEKGQALILAMMVLLVIFTTGSAIVSVSGSHRRAVTYGHDQMQAYYTADAGVEKVLAQVSEDPAWADGLVAGQEVSFYNDSSLTVKITKEYTAGGTVLLVESVGRHDNGQRTLEAEIKLNEPLDFTRGIWAESPPDGPSTFANNARVESDIFSEGEINARNNVLVDGLVKSNGNITVKNNSTVTGDIFSRGNVEIENNANPVGDIYAVGNVTLGNNAKLGGNVQAGGDVVLANNLEINYDVKAGGDVTLQNNGTVNGNVESGGSIELRGNARIFGDVKAVGDVALNSNAEVHGSIYSMGDIFLDKYCEVEGDIYANGNIDIEKNVEIGGDVYPGQNLNFIVQLDLDFEAPRFPETDENWYRNRADVIYAGEDLEDGKKTFSLNSGSEINGVHFVEGDVDISGTYRGDAVIVATGEINITGDLKPLDGDDESRLTLVSFDEIVVSSNNNVKALFYSDGTISLNNNVEVAGSIIARTVNFSNNAVFTYEPYMAEEETETSSRTVEVLSWKEKYPVFPGSIDD